MAHDLKACPFSLPKHTVEGDQHRNRWGTCPLRAEEDRADQGCPHSPPSLRMVSDISELRCAYYVVYYIVVCYIGIDPCPHSDSSFLSSSSPPSRLSSRLLKANPRRLNPYPPTPPPCSMSPPSNPAIPGSNSGSSLSFPYGKITPAVPGISELRRLTDIK